MALTPIFPAMVNTAIIVNHRIRHWEINGREAGKFTYREIDPVSIAPAQELKDGCKGLPYSYLNMIIANFMSNDNEWFYDIIVTTMNEMIYSSIA